jgi:hypothetical protein
MDSQGMGAGASVLWPATRIEHRFKSQRKSPQPHSAHSLENSQPSKHDQATQPVHTTRNATNPLYKPMPPSNMVSLSSKHSNAIRTSLAQTSTSRLPILAVSAMRSTILPSIHIAPATTASPHSFSTPKPILPATFNAHPPLFHPHPLALRNRSLTSSSALEPSRTETDFQHYVHSVREQEMNKLKAILELSYSSCAASVILERYRDASLESIECDREMLEEGLTDRRVLMYVNIISYTRYWAVVVRLGLHCFCK